MRKFTLFLMSLFLSLGAMAENYKVGQAVTDVTTGYYVVVGTFNPGNGTSTTTGPVYYATVNGDSEKYWLDQDKAINSGDKFSDGNYVWYVENNGSTITLKNVQDNVYFVKDAARNQNFGGTETANLLLEKTSNDDTKFFLHLQDDAIGYIHCNSRDNDPCLSYWNSHAESGSTSVRFQFYKVEIDYYEPYQTGERTGQHSHKQITAINLNDSKIINNPTPGQLYVDLTESETFTVAPGEEITVTLTKNSTTNQPVDWIHSYIYIDFDGDGFEYVDGDAMPLGDLVSYSFKSTSADQNTGKNSAGETGISAKDALEPIPSFNAPTAPGAYRMRYKMAWNNYENPEGDAAWVSDAGTIIDFILVVASSEPREVNATTEGGGSITINGGTEAVNVAGGVTLVATPNYGYKFVGWTLNGETVSTGATYVYSGADAAEFVAVFEKMTIDEQYSLIDKPTFALSTGNITDVSQIEFNGKNITDFASPALGTVGSYSGLKVKAGTTYTLKIGYKLDWGDIVLYQIDNNGENAKYGPYACEWISEGDPLTILFDSNPNMYKDFDLDSNEDFETIDKYIWLPYQITIDESLEAGDLVVVRLVAGTPASGTTTYNQGRCLDLLLEVEDAETYTLNVTNAGYSTMYLDYAVTIPQTAEVYTAIEVDDKFVKLNKVEGVLPANTAVVVKNEGVHTFVPAENNVATIESNLLMGTTEDAYIEGGAYVLSNLDGIGFYKATLNKNAAGGTGTTHFKNNANKAYLPASALTALQNTAAFYGFDWDGTTGIEKVEIRNEKSEIYDLTGRRVEAITAPGIYIVGGKKVLVK